MRILRFAAWLLILALLFPALHVTAKGMPSKVVLSGPGIKQPVEVEDRRTLDALGMGALENTNFDPLENAPVVGEGYDLVRYAETETGKLVAFDHVRYFPKAADGNSYVYYVGPVSSSSWSELDNKWYVAAIVGQMAMDDLLKTYVRPETSAQPDLTAVPQNCKVGTALKAVKNSSLPAISLTDTVWATGFAGPQATLKITPDAANAEPDAHGWAQPVRWIVTQKSFSRITVWATNLEDNSPVWFELPGQPATTMLSLVPKLGSASKDTPGHVEFPSTVYLPKAGCYDLQVFVYQKPTSILFAAGR